MSPGADGFIGDAGLCASVRHILVIENDAAVRRREADLLSRAGFNVDAVGDGEAGWRALSEKRYDLLITDHQISRLSGLGLVWRLQAAKLTLPIVMTSGLAPVEVVNPADEPAPWFDALLRRPLTACELVDIVRQILGNGGCARPGQGRAIPSRVR